MYKIVKTGYIIGSSFRTQLIRKAVRITPGRMIGGDIFENRKHKLPEAPGRIWYEADFDYAGGYRNNCRLLYSNDGLLFVTYDHYISFREIGSEGLW